MALETELDPERSVLTLRIPERFDFSLHRAFRDAYMRQSQSARSYVIDLGESAAIDSAALGMLLLLREHAGGERAEIHIVNGAPAIRELLCTAGFDRLFVLH